MKIKINLITIILLYACLTACASTTIVGLKYSKEVNLTKDIKGTCIVEINGKSWNDTITTTITIFQNDKIIYSYSAKDLFYETDEYFEIENFDNCTNFIDCKKKFYNKLMNDIVISSQKRCFAKDAEKHLKSDLELNPTHKKYDVDKFIEYLITEKYDQFFIPESLWKTYSILVFNKELMAFIDIHVE